MESLSTPVNINNKICKRLISGDEISSNETKLGIGKIPADNISECAEMSSCNKKKALSIMKAINRKLVNKSRHVTQPSRILELGYGTVHELLELDNGNIAITGIKDSKIRIFDFITGRLKAELNGHKDYVMGMVNIPNKCMLVSYS
jgi:hypothetical protein